MLIQPRFPSMKIRDIKAYRLEAALAEPFAYSQAWYERRGALLVRPSRHGFSPHRRAADAGHLRNLFLRRPPVRGMRSVSAFFATLDGAVGEGLGFLPPDFLTDPLARAANCPQTGAANA